MLAKDPSLSSKMHWFLSFHKVQSIACITKSHSNLILLSLPNIRSPYISWLTSWVRTQDTLNFSKMVVQSLYAMGQCKNKWFIDSLSNLHMTHQLGEIDKKGCLFCKRSWVFSFLSIRRQLKTLTLLGIEIFQMTLWHFKGYFPYVLQLHFEKILQILL